MNAMRNVFNVIGGSTLILSVCYCESRVAMSQKSVRFEQRHSNSADMPKLTDEEQGVPFQKTF